MFSVGANVLPALLLPLVGAAIAHDHGEIAMIGLAALSVLAGVVNLRPAVPAEG